MREDSSFETVKIDLSKELDGLDDEIDLGAGNWITFGYIPSDVQVFFALDNNSSSKIQAKQGLQIKVPHSKVYLWSVGTNSTEQMEIMHWGSSDIQMIMPPRSDFDSLNGYGSLALAQLDKIINPYNAPTITQGSTTSTSLTTMLSKTLSCDLIKLNLSLVCTDSAYSGANGIIRAKLNGIHILNSNSGNGYASIPFISGKFNVKNGDILEIFSDIYSSTLENTFYLEEHTLKQ